MAKTLKLVLKLIQKKEDKISDFLKEDVDNSLHEFIQNKFQDRGAGHIHGVLWIKIRNLEKLIKTPEGDLIDPDHSKDSGSNTQQDKIRPFKYLTRAFKKILNEEILEDEDKEALKNFVNEYTTCSLNPATVGEDVAKIAYEVNRHHHTKTCRKYLLIILEENICRFGYKKYPSPFTIIVVPYQLTGEERDKKFQIRAETLAKVREILNDEDLIQQIMDKYNKKSESKEEYKINREIRIREILKLAGVTMAD